MRVQPLSVQAIQQRLGARPVHYSASVGSTNAEAKQLAAAGAPAGTLVIADEQTAGKGRMGRHWLAPPNTCLLMSLVFRPALAPQEVHRLTMLCSLAAAEAIEAQTGLAIGIKWPNDLIVPRTPPYRKLAGLLTETSFTGRALEYAVVGMGINVNVDPATLGPVLTPATSLMTELGRPVDRLELLAAILQRIEDRLPVLSAGQLHQDWSGRLVTLGQSVTATTPEKQMHGLAEAVDQDGALLLRDLAGNLQRISVGDVTLRLS